MHRRLALLSALLVLLPMAATPTRADEERRDGRLSTRIYEVGAITRGIQDFIRPAAPAETGFDVSDEERPLFGAPMEEPQFPFGMSDELIELIKGYVDPAMWEQTEGADILSLGEERLVARCPRGHHDRIGAFLVRLEREGLTPLAIDVRVVPVAEVGAEEKGRALAAVGVSALPRQRAVAWDGAQTAYVYDYNVEVASDARISEPLVNVGNTGLILQASAYPAPEGGEIRLALNAIYTELVKSERVSVGENREVEKPTYRTFRCFSDAFVKPGVWTALNTSTHVDGSRVAYEVRVTPHTVPLRPTAPAHAFLDPQPFDDSGAMVARMLDVGRLSMRAADIRGQAAWNIWPSRYTPPEPPELPDPMPLFPADALPDALLTTMGDSGVWEQGSIEVRNGRLLMRNTPPVLDAAEGIVNKLRRGSLRTTTIECEVVETSADAAGWLAETGSFDPAERKQAFRGAAVKSVFAGRIVCPKDARRNLATGTDFHYVGDYVVEIAEKSSISNPVIHYVFEGTQIEVWPSLGSTETATTIQVEYVSTRRRQEDRWTATPHGRLDTPLLDTTRFQTTVFAPIDRTVVAGVSGNGPTRRVLLLTTRLSRATK